MKEEGQSRYDQFDCCTKLMANKDCPSSLFEPTVYGKAEGKREALPRAARGDRATQRLSVERNAA